MDIKWIKLMIDVFDDEKFDAIRTLPDSNDIQLAWIKLLCLAGTCDKNGFLMLSREIPYTDEMLSKRFDMEIGVVQRALHIFCKLRMIEVVDNIYMVSNWLKYQHGDKLDEFREKNRLRQERFRERQKQLALNKNSDLPEEKWEGDDRNVTDNVKNNVNCSISISNSSLNNNLSNLETNINLKDNLKDPISLDTKEDNRAKLKDINDFFGTVWKAYPRKLGKGKISDSRKRKLYEEVGQEQMLRCIERYRQSVSEKDEQYIMYGSTFFNSGYVDFLDENYNTDSTEDKTKQESVPEEIRPEDEMTDEEWLAEWDRLYGNES